MILISTSPATPAAAIKVLLLFSPEIYSVFLIISCFADCINYITCVIKMNNYIYV